MPKTYQVRVKGRVEGAALEKLKRGIWLSEGKTGRAAVKVLKRSSTETTLQVTITQGLNRQVRRMMARLGYKVKALKRTRIANISIKGIPRGRYKNLAKGQIAYLKRITEI